MFTIALFEPEIPPNTGNAMRLAANTGANLALIEPLGFEMTDTRLKRAGLDYREIATTTIYPDLPTFLEAVRGRRILAFSTRGKTRYDTIDYRIDDVLMFGPETRGLPDELLESMPEAHRARIPMASNSRSINLANSISIALYEAWRQHDFA